MCNSCSYNKSHSLSFFVNTLQCTRPPQILFSDLWGPSQVLCIDNKVYYLIFVNYFTKYTYTIKNKNEVLDIFKIFDPLIEHHFQYKINSLYTDGGREILGLRPYLRAHGIEHITSRPYTPQRVATAERRHRHIIETAKTLLYQASLPALFWSLACHHAIFLINKLPSQPLHNKSPYEALFGNSPDYTQIRVFGCLCYPWLRPYTSNKF